MAETMGLRVCQICAVDFTLRKFLLPLIDGMTAKGWTVTAVCSDGPYIQELREAGYQLETIPIARSMNPWSAFSSLIALIRYFRAQAFDVVHAHTPVAALIARDAERIAGVPLVIYTAHGFYFHDEMPSWKHWLFVFLERMGGQFTDLLFCQSTEDAADAIRLGIMDPENVLAIGNGVDVSRFNPAKFGTDDTGRDALGIPSDAFVVGLVGRQVREKGVAEFLSAMITLAGKYSNLWVLIVGERLASDHAQGVEREFTEARQVLSERLVAPGLRNDIPVMLAAMDLFCLPSWREGMPRTIIEAMMMGKPVVATNIRGSREEVIQEQTGLLVPTRSPALLAAAIARCLEQPEWAAEMGNKGRLRAMTLYDEAKVVQLQLERIEAEASKRSMI